MILTHQIALDLTDAEQNYCARAAGTARFTYNWALAEWKRQYAAGGKPTAHALKKQWNQVKHEHYPWVAEVHKDTNQQPFTNLGTAFTRFFHKEARYPAFKKKGVHDAFYISNDKCEVKGKRFRIPRLGWVRMREALRFTGALMSAVVSRIADRWFVSLAVRLEDAPHTCESQACVGVDLGVLTLATLSRAISDMGFGIFRRLLDYKAAYAGCQVVVAHRWFPSSKLCAQCGAIAEELPLSQRVFRCTCGYKADRDVHAAVNLEHYPWLVGKSTPVESGALAGGCPR